MTQNKLERIAIVLNEIMKEKRVRRGVLHLEVCRLIEEPRSNYNVKLIKAVLKVMGAREITIRGNKYYTLMAKPIKV